MAKAVEKLYTLEEIGKKTKISLPTLQRYKKLYGHQIPSRSDGLRERYPEEALAVFTELQRKNIGRRGRPRKSSVGNGAKAAGDPAKRVANGSSKNKSSDLMTLTQISELTGISYPTLLRYVKTHLGIIPHQGVGRSRRFKPEAVSVFEDLRAKNRRGRRSSKADTTALQDRLRQLEENQAKLEKSIASLSFGNQGSIGRGRHVAKPANAREIREALGVNPNDVRIAQRILKGVR